MKARLLLAVVLVASLGSACAQTSERGLGALDDLSVTATTVGPTTPSTVGPPGQEAKDRCGKIVGDDPALVTPSYAPAALLPAAVDVAQTDSLMRDILANGGISVGVDENTLGFAARDTDDGEIKGFEVDLAYEIAARIFPGRTPSDLVKLVDLVPVVTADKVSKVTDGKVDFSISAISMTCDRWGQVAFSAEYYTATQSFLMRRDTPIDTEADLAGRTVCVTAGSSSAKIMKDSVMKRVPNVTLLEVPARTDCLVALQEGTADAYFGHDSFLAGMMVQDPTLMVPDTPLLPEGETTSHYGIAIAHGHPDFVRFVNGVLAEVAASGKWVALHQEWLEGQGPSPHINLCPPNINPCAPDPPTAAYLPEPIDG